MNRTTRKRCLASLVALTLAGCTAEEVSTESSAAELGAAVSITLVHVNDTHEHLSEGGPRTANLAGTRGGIARAYRVIQEIKQQEKNVLLVHAGDVFQGSIFFNAYTAIPELQLMQQLGWDVMAVGNHDLDLGPDGLLQVLDAAFAGAPGFPLVSANLDMAQAPTLASRVHPTVMKDVSGIKVGIFGLTIPDLLENVPPGFVSDDLVGAAQASVDALRAAGADVVIGLTHLGGADQIVAENVTGIDLIIGGHRHEVLRHPRVFTDPAGHRTRVFQAGAFFEHVGRVKLTVVKNKRGTTIHYDDYGRLDIVESLAPDPSVEAYLAELRGPAAAAEARRSTAGMGERRIAPYYATGRACR
jgi:5'-nucleotidase